MEEKKACSCSSGCEKEEKSCTCHAETHDGSDHCSCHKEHGGDSCHCHGDDEDCGCGCGCGHDCGDEEKNELSRQLPLLVVGAVLFVLCLLSVFRMVPYLLLTVLVAAVVAKLEPKLLRQVDIQLMDHYIIANDDMVSMRESGVFETF